MPTLYDLEIDPITRDLIDTGDGQFREATDSRTAVLWQLEERADEGWADEGTGSLIGRLLEREEPATADELLDAARAALQLLVDEAVIADLEVTAVEDAPGRTTVLLSYTDVASGRRVQDVVIPFGGA